MRKAFAHDAVLAIESPGDIRAPGGAITIELCGSWEHDAPCPVAPHHTSPTRIGREVRLRILFAVEPAGEADVRRRIDGALAEGQLRGPDGDVTHWQVLSSGSSSVLPEETDHAQRIALS